MNRAEAEVQIAAMWADGDYTQNQAKLTAQLQGLNWDAVQATYGRLYEAEQKKGAGQWN